MNVSKAAAQVNSSDDLLETIKTVNISLRPQDVLVKGSYLIRTDDGGYSLSLWILTRLNPAWIKERGLIQNSETRNGQDMDNTHVLHDTFISLRVTMDFVALVAQVQLVVMV